MSQPIPIVDERPLTIVERESNRLPAESTHREMLVRQLRDRHCWILGISLFVLTMPFLLRIDDTGRVETRWLNVELPPLCGSRALFNVECPGCGLTRSFVALAAGDIQGSLRYHRLGWLIALAVATQIPYRLFALRELRARRIVNRSWPFWLFNFLIALLMANWLLILSGLL